MGRPACGEEPLHHVLVHAGRGAEHAGADVGDAGQFEQPLDRAVLAEGAVQHGKDDVERLAVQRQLVEQHFVGTRPPAQGESASGSPPAAAWRRAWPRGRRRADGGRPRCCRHPAGCAASAAASQWPSLVMPIGHHVEFLAVDCLQDGGGREQRNFMLAAAPAKQNAYAKFLAMFLFHHPWRDTPASRGQMNLVSCRARRGSERVMPAGLTSDCQHWR